MIYKPRRRSSRPRGTSSNRMRSWAMLHQSRNGAANQPKGSRLARTILRLCNRPPRPKLILLRPRITSLHWISRSLLLLIQIGSHRYHRARTFCIISIRSKVHMLLPSIPWALRWTQASKVLSSNYEPITKAISPLEDPARTVN